MVYRWKIGEKWIGIDLDGTLAYAGPNELEPDGIGDPIPTMLQFVKDRISEGHRVKIFTARAGWPESVPYVEKWLVKHGIGGLEITNVKDMDCGIIYDDKAVSMQYNSGLQVGLAAPTLITVNQEPPSEENPS